MEAGKDKTVTGNGWVDQKLRLRHNKSQIPLLSSTLGYFWFSCSLVRLHQADRRPLVWGSCSESPGNQWVSAGHQWPSPELETNSLDWSSKL